MNKKTEAIASVLLFSRQLELEACSEHDLITVEIVDASFSTKREKLC